MSLERLLLAFIPLFVAFDALGLLPLFWSLSQGLSRQQRQQAIVQATVVAWFVGPLFLLVSEWIFRLLGIEMADAMIAGGVILFGLSLSDLLHPEKTPYASSEGLGIVPLGVPLIVGPAVLTSLLLLRKRYGIGPTLASFHLNVILTGLILLASEWLVRWIGRGGMKVISKISSLVLAAFAVMLVRQGLMTLLQR